MTGKIQTYFSNQVELLCRNFKEAVFAPQSSPFSRRLVIVPTPALKSWLMLQLAKDPDVGIAAGLEIGLLDETIEKLRGLFAASEANTKRVPTLLELGLAIEAELRELIKHYSKMLAKDQETWESLIQYLHIQPGKPLSRKSERRLLALTEKMAQLFRQYGKYGREMLLEWEMDKAQGWQPRLWNRLFQKNPAWTYIYRELSKDIQRPAMISNHQVFLFSISYLPPLYFNFLQKIAGFISVHQFLLSPCQLFWSDVRSDKESRRLASFWKKKGVSEQELMQLDVYLRDKNPLLANFGRLGREMAQQIENSDAETFENYALPQSISENPHYHSFMVDPTELTEPSDPLTLLKAVQADMLLLRNPSTEQKVPFDDYDKSIQVHASCTRLREMQSLYDTLASIMLEHAHEDEPVTAKDIIVMAPDIMEYEPYIKMVFQGPESKLDVHIMDLHAPDKDPLVQSFTHLLALPQSRWDAISLLQLFEYPAFRRRHQLTHEDLDQVRDWIKDARICWGADFQHRNELLQRDHCENGLMDPSLSGTWEFGVARLLSGLAMDPSSVEESRILPIEPLKIEPSQGELLGKVIRLLRSLRDDLKPLSDGTALSLKNWAAYLQCLFEAYFREDSGEDGDSYDFIQKAIQDLRNASRFFQNEKYTFASIKKHLDSILSQSNTSYRESHLNAVRFCSLVPMRTIPVKIIVLLGMQEGCYPRRDQTAGLNLMSGNAKADYFPTQTEFDRYLFLEALLSARRYFIMSYLGYSQKDYKEQAPSLLVTELMNYLDRAYLTQGKKPSEFCQFKHPYHAFDGAYFNNGSLLKSYSKSQFEAAQAFYPEPKNPAHNFIPEFQIGDPKILVNELRLNIRDLYAFAKDPLKVYFNKKLGIYLENDEDRIIETEEAFLLSHLELDELKKMTLFKPFEEVVELARKRGMLPAGLFKHLSMEILKEKSDELKGNLKAVDVDPRELFKIEFAEHYRKAERTKDGHWLLPPLKINYKDAVIKVVGKLNNVSPQGLVAFVNQKNASRSWPQFLAYHCLAQEHGLETKTNLILAKEGVSKPHLSDNPHALMEQFLDYYFAGMEKASPLIPELIPLFLKKESNLKEDLEKTLADNEYKSVHNDYWDWILLHSEIPGNFELWKEYAEKVYGHMHEKWFGK